MLLADEGASNVPAVVFSFPFKVFIGQSSAAPVRCLNKGADIDSSPLIFGGYESPIGFPFHPFSQP